MIERHDPQHWAALAPFDPTAGSVIRQPPQAGSGYWVGAPSVTGACVVKCC